MRSMRIKLMSALVLLSLGLTTNVAEAGRPFASFRRFLQPSQHTRSLTYQQRYEYANRRYPKYTGAFHASYFQSIGVPTGDIGFRGNGVYMTPW